MKLFFAKSSFLLLLLCLIVIGGGYETTFAQSQSAALLEEINSKNKKLDAPIFTMDKYRYDFDNKKPKLTEMDPVLFFNTSGTMSPNNDLTKEEARLEANYLIRMFRTQYGLYTYYGGDAMFEKAEQAILKELEGSGKISPRSYQNIVTRNLSFISDSHLSFGDYRFFPRVTLFSNEQMNIYYSNGAYFMDEAFQNPILLIDGESPKNYIKHAIGNDGKLTYYLYAMRPDADETKLKLSYQENGKKREDFVTLKPAQYIGISNTGSNISLPTFQYDTERGFPTVQINDMSFGWNEQDKQNETYQSFIRSAQEIKKYPFAIIDLRNNPGGNAQLANEWFKAYTEEDLMPNYCEMRIKPGEVWRSKVFPEAKDWNDYVDIMAQMKMKEDGDYYILAPEKQYLKNDTVIFVLTSRKTGSAAEAMTDALRNLENVVIIGTNTDGVLINGANYRLEMPYSHLYLQLGEEFRNWNEGDFKEGYGLKPDLYLTGEDAAKNLELFLNQFTKELTK